MNSKRIWEIINDILLPFKLMVPQPIIASIPGLTTNEMIRNEMVRKHVENRLLDIGCGNNRLVQNYRSNGGLGLGIDVYPWKGVDEVVNDTSRLDFEDGSFDTITFVACLNHIPNRENVLVEANRLLSRNGKVIITNLSPGLSFLWHKIAFWDKDQHERGMAEGEVWGFSKQEVVEMLKKFGFELTHYNRFSLGLNELYVAVKENR